jgi:hypothetical protein
MPQTGEDHSKGYGHETGGDRKSIRREPSVARLCLAPRSTWPSQLVETLQSPLLKGKSSTRVQKFVIALFHLPRIDDPTEPPVIPRDSS